MILVAALLVASHAGTITVHSTNGGARVSVDGAAVGLVPLTLRNIAAGKHHVRVQHLGYLAFEQDVEVTAGKTVEVEADLLPTAGVVKVTSSTKGALVFVDGKAMGGAPYEGEVSVGKRVIEIRKDGFATYKQVLQVGAGNDYAVTATLKKGSSAVAASTDVPLVAVAPRRTKAAPPGELALEAPPSAGPKTPLGLQPPPLEATAVAAPSSPVYQKWWFWTVAGVVVAGAVVTTVVLTQSGSSSCLSNSAACFRGLNHAL